MTDHQEREICNERWKQVQKHLDESPLFKDNVNVIAGDVKELMLRVKILEDGVMKNAIIGGLIGALIGSGAAPAVTGLINLLMVR